MVGCSILIDESCPIVPQDSLTTHQGYIQIFKYRNKIWLWVQQGS